MRGERESGQVMPFVAVVLMAVVLIAVAVAKVGGIITARMRVQTAVDATALSAATAYSRALNVAAVSNEMLITAALADLGLKVFGSSMVKVAAKPLKVLGMGLPSSFTEMVERFQDVWAGRPAAGVFSVPGTGALMMQGAAAACAAGNGLDALVFWNDREDPGGLAPDLNLRRATMADIAWLLGKGSEGEGGGSGRFRVKYEGKQEKETYSYRDRKTGKRVEVPAEKVEKIAFRNRGKARTAARVGERGGKFLKAGKGTEKVLKFLDVPFPLVEREPVHRVLVVARSRAPLPAIFAGLSQGTGLTAAARAQAGGGAVFDAAFGNPAFEPGLVRISGGAGAGSLAMVLLRDPRSWEAWAKNAAAGAAWNWARNALAQASRRPPGPGI